MSDYLDPDDPQWIDPQEDGMHPPSIPQLVECVECGEEYDSWRIEWRVTRDAAGRVHGWWVCPVPGCGGAGFGFDIWPVDYDETGTWTDSDGREMHVGCTDDDDDFDEEFEDEDWSAGTGEVRDFDKFDDDDIPF